MSYVLIPRTINISKFSKQCSKTRLKEAFFGTDSDFQMKKYIITFIYFWMDGWVCKHSPRAPRLQHHTVIWTFISDGCTVINNVFPLWAIKYFHSGSLGWSAELKGASTVVVEGRRIFGAQNFPSSLKQRRVATHHIQWCYYVCW